MNKLMKNPNNKVKYAILLMVTVLIISCSGEDGEMGPAGTDGKDGADGKDGNANVATVLVENSSFIKGNKKFPIDAITQNILNDGAVLVYMRIPSTPSIWYALPYFFNTNRVSISTIKLNEVTINANYNSAVPVDFKFIIIAGNTAKSSKNNKTTILSNLNNNGVDVNDYNQVAQFYNLEQ